MSSADTLLFTWKDSPSKFPTKKYILKAYICKSFFKVKLSMLWMLSPLIVRTVKKDLLKPKLL